MTSSLLDQIDAKITLLTALQVTRHLPPEVLAGALHKIGADLTDALPGGLGQELSARVNADLQRLEAGDFEPGDEVKWKFGPRTLKSRVVSVAGTSMKVDYNGGHNINRSEAVSEGLEGLRALKEACSVLLG